MRWLLFSAAEVARFTVVLILSNHKNSNTNINALVKTDIDKNTSIYYERQVRVLVCEAASLGSSGAAGVIHH